MQLLFELWPEVDKIQDRAIFSPPPQTEFYRVLWLKFTEFIALTSFARNLTVKNDIAERVIKLVSDFADKCESEEQ